MSPANITVLCALRELGPSNALRVGHSLWLAGFWFPYWRSAFLLYGLERAGLVEGTAKTGDVLTQAVQARNRLFHITPRGQLTLLGLRGHPAGGPYR